MLFSLWCLQSCLHQNNGICHHFVFCSQDQNLFQFSFIHFKDFIKDRRQQSCSNFRGLARESGIVLKKLAKIVHELVAKIIFTLISWYLTHYLLSCWEKAGKQILCLPLLAITFFLLKPRKETQTSMARTIIFWWRDG